MGLMILIIATVNIIFSMWACKLSHYGLRVIALLIVPLIIALIFYYAPVLMKGDSGEYSSWSGLFLTTWWIVGVLSQLFGCFVRWLLNKKEH